ncbi:MAG: nuclear transport factor 2 family protein [Caulobacteraceae bacterium]
MNRVLLLSAAALAVVAAPAFAKAPRTTQANLLDRIQIEDLLVDYYAPLGGGKQESLADFFTPDGVIDVNGRGLQRPQGHRAGLQGRRRRQQRQPDLQGQVHDDHDNRPHRGEGRPRHRRRGLDRHRHDQGHRRSPLRRAGARSTTTSSR